jgi:hypothetical protein
MILGTAGRWFFLAPAWCPEIPVPRGEEGSPLESLFT